MDPISLRQSIQSLAHGWKEMKYADLGELSFYAKKHESYISCMGCRRIIGYMTDAQFGVVHYEQMYFICPKCHEKDKRDWEKQK